MIANDYGGARFVADTAQGQVLAGVDLEARPDQVFPMLAGPAVCNWWVRPGVFDTREWSGEFRRGGQWRATGVGGGKPYAIAGEFLEVVPVERLVHTWQGAGAPGAPSIVAYRLEPIEGGTRLTIRHSGLVEPVVCRNTGIGWETSLMRLAEMFSEAAASAA
jgi:uncharacterized protein YndB with AHSA1/START domain